MHANDRTSALRVLSRGAALCAALMAVGCSDSEPANRRPVTPVDPATAGTIRVNVSYPGAVPAGQPLNMSGAPGCAAAHPEPVVDRPLAVAGGKVENAVVYIKSGLGDRGFDIPTEPVVVDQRGCLYHPRVAAAMVSQPIKFVNSDTEPHNVRGRPQNVSAWNFMIGVQNASRTIQINKPEVGIRVGCDIHPWMLAFVSVFDHPYFGVSKSDGAVTLEKVPPGEYVIAAWHEKLGGVEKNVSLPARGSVDVDLSYGAGSAGG